MRLVGYLENTPSFGGSPLHPASGLGFAIPILAALLAAVLFSKKTARQLSGGGSHAYYTKKETRVVRASTLAISG